MGIGYAALAIKAGLTPLQTVGFSILVYAGAGEIIAVTMLLNGATALAIILTNFVVNLRYFVMNVCVYNKIEKSSLLVNALSSHLTTDESFAMFSLMDESSIWTYIGISLTSWLSWVLGAAIGVFVLDLLPVIVTNSFNISLYALFVAILIPNVKKNYRIGLLVIITGVINILLQNIIGNWSIIVSTLLGALIGVYLINDAYFLTDNGGIK